MLSRFLLSRLFTSNFGRICQKFNSISTSKPEPSNVVIIDDRS